MLDLPDLSPDAPAGESLENDSAFGALERATRGKPEQQHGDLIIPAEDPDWKEVDAQASALLGTTRDLRILQYLALARLNLRGLTGFAEVLRAVRTQLETNWPYVHPQLDPEDDNDPTLRANALLGLSDSGRVLRVLRDLPLAISTRAGKISWRDIGVAIGAIEAPDDRDRLTETTIRGAFQDADQARLAALREALVSLPSRTAWPFRRRSKATPVMAPARISKSSPSCFASCPAMSSAMAARRRMPVRRRAGRPASH